MASAASGAGLLLVAAAAADMINALKWFSLSMLRLELLDRDEEREDNESLLMLLLLLLRLL